MNLTVIAILATVLILVFGALYATFSGTRDTYSYAEHYGKNGFSQEIQTPCGESEVPADDRDASAHVGECADEVTKHSDTARSAGYDPPVIEWPTDL